MRSFFTFFFFLEGVVVATFQTASPPRKRSTQLRPRHLMDSGAGAVDRRIGNSETTAKPPCFWKHPTESWKHRVDLEDLVAGQKLTGGVVFQELLAGKTGAKVFLDCGVGRIDKKNGGSWQIVTGMYRIKDRKTSVIAKKAAKLRQKSKTTGIDLWVSRIYPANSKFEVVLSEDDVPSPDSTKTKIPASSLTVGQELIGTVARVEPFGVMVDVGANRNGLLHIQRVADLVQHYVNKEEGLIEEGLEKGAKIRVCVASNEKKRLFLDFPADVKEEVERELAKKTAKISKSSGSGMSDDELAAWAEFAAAGSPQGSSDSRPTASASVSTGDSPGISEDEAAAWADYGASDVDYDDESDDDYDEDRDIEDALGIGMY